MCPILLFFFYFSEAGSHCIALTRLELAIKTRLATYSESICLCFRIYLPLLPEYCD